MNCTASRWHPKGCPCSSGRSYVDCCAPYHRLLRTPPDAVALMRSRYAAFAVKDAEYLWRTLHPDHDDRAHPKEAAVRAIRQVCSENRYMGLEILDHHAADEHGVARVLFFAKVFTRGRDLSFVECSEFLNDGEGWRYLTGTLILTSEIKGERSSLTIAEILKR